MYKLTRPQKSIYDMEKFSGGAIAVICGSFIQKGDAEASRLKYAVNELYRINDALRTRIVETDSGPMQTVIPYENREIEPLCFDSKTALEAYAENYAKIPFDFYGKLCELTPVMLPNYHGILAKIHHIICDAWSIALMGTQFAAILNGETPAAYSYEEYADSETAYAKSGRYQKDKAYFLEQFQKCDEVTFLSDSSGDSFKASRKTFVISQEKARVISDYAKEHDTSPFALFMTTLAVYISRVKLNAEKFYIGTAVLNRTGKREKNTVGLFINTAPMLAELDNVRSFAENLASVKKSSFAVFRHQKFNYEEVLSSIRKEYGFTGRLYDVTLSYQNASIVSDVESETVWYHSGAQSESLQIHIDDRDCDGIFKIHYDYQLDKFTDSAIDRLHRHILNLLFDAIRHDDKKIRELDMLSDEEKRLLASFNDTAANYPRNKCVHTLFEEQASKTPDKTAVIACDKTLTYQELNEQANRIAHGLLARGVQTGDVVAFALPRKSCLIAAMLGILKAGGAYLPIDTDYPQDRVRYMLSDSKAKFYITEENISGLLENTCTDNPAIPVSVKNGCYCIYTSGSTGKPKGSMLTHGGTANYLSGNRSNGVFYQLIQKGLGRIVSVTTVSFDIFTTETLFPLTNGLEILLADEKQSRFQADLNALILRYGADIIQTTPTKMKLLMSDSGDLEYLREMKAVILGGEALDFPFVRRLKEITNAEIFNVYGPSECTVWCTNAVISDPADITIGKPIANTQIYIVDKYLQPVPIGVTGELCVTGDGVGAGYLNRPELTAERFIDNPFGAGKLYKTGDLAYWREDGNIAYVGRNDFQVKVRGLRIELGEIENAISEIDGITQAVVVVRKNSDGRQFICAFYTGAENQNIRSVISRKLPQYMIPHVITHLDSMPLTASGKANRNALPEVDLSHAEHAAQYVAPTTEPEKALVVAVESVLNLKNVGMSDNFFDLGGDSLRAIELISALEDIGYTTDTKAVFQCATMRELAARLQKGVSFETRVSYQNEFPATAAQMRVYTAQNMDADSTLYNIPYAFRTNALNPERLQTAVNQLAERHESLRTRFEDRDGQVIQIVDDSVSVLLEQWESDDMLAFVRPFNLSRSPLWRVGYSGNTVMMDFHHSIADGGSMPVLLRELNELYMGRTIETPAVQYRRFASETFETPEDEAYWLSVYADDIPELEIRTDFKRGQKRSFRGRALYDTLDAALHREIVSKCREFNITPFAFYMGGFSILLSKFSGNEDIVIGAPVSGREGRYLDTAGMFVNTIALRNRPVGSLSVREFLHTVKENSVNAISHQNYPYGKLVKKLNVNAVARNPLFDVMLAYQSDAMMDVTFGDCPAELLPIPVTTSKYDFTFNVMPGKSGVVLMTEYCADLYREATILRLLNSYKLILGQMLNGNLLLKDISAISAQEQARLLIDFNQTAIPFSRRQCVHQLFEEQVSKTPDKLAVIACDKTLTYQELNEQANRMAHSLMAAGVGVGDIVAFALPRKSSLIAAMLGILKAGACYLPIDPDHPKDRIRYMLADSHAKLYVTDENVSQFMRNNCADNPQTSVSGNDACYCIYTSGSTGTPKGALLTHASVVNYADNNAHNIVVHKIISENYRRIVSVTTVGFDIFVTESLLPLANGMEILLANEEQSRVQTALNALLQAYDADVIQTTPTKMKILIADRTQLGYLRKMKVVILGGEALDTALVHNLKEITNAKIFNIYGPTETTVWATNAEVSNPDDITIGKPIANTQIYIVDKYLQPVPIGVTGELCIAGGGVGAGYLNRPELTAERFIDNPFGAGKLYKTGDLAYWREDGNIAYVGRNDFQVKIRGLRIELGEIENAIASIDGITQTATVVRKDAGGRQYICAYYTGAEIPAKEIRGLLALKLPKYMLPHVCTRLDEMPLTASGKINRKALPEVDLSAVEPETEYVKPEGEIETHLAALMERVLEYSPVGRDDNFFDIGGDSLRAIEFVSFAHSEGMYFALQNIFDYPTVRQLAECMLNGNRQLISYDDADFTEINRILSKNTAAQIHIPARAPLGNILLTGATGFLGIHLLAEYLEYDDGIAYCLIRGKDAADSERRLSESLQFYFGNRYASNERIKVIRGDLGKESIGMDNQDYFALSSHVDTVINAAASVKHYGSYQYFYEANVQSVKALIDFCQRANAKLIHISTLSVSGNSFADDFNGHISDVEKHFYESNLYIGQSLENVYARSKFEAERLALDAMSQGFPANIMRMGNLTNRLSDGVFQKNHESNAFLKRFKAILELGVFPDYLKDLYAEFTPVDEAARAVMTIARHFSAEQSVFHINSTKVIYLNRLAAFANELGYPLSIVRDADFTEALRNSAKSRDTEHIFETFINDMDENDRLVYDSNIHIENAFTEGYLRRLGFEWSELGLPYLRKYTDYFEKIGYLRKLSAP